MTSLWGPLTDILSTDALINILSLSLGEITNSKVCGWKKSGNEVDVLLCLKEQNHLFEGRFDLCNRIMRHRILTLRCSNRCMRYENNRNQPRKEVYESLPNYCRPSVLNLHFSLVKHQVKRALLCENISTTCRSGIRQVILTSCLRYKLIPNLWNPQTSKKLCVISY